MSQNLREHVTLKMRLRVCLESQVLERPRFRRLRDSLSSKTLSKTQAKEAELVFL